MLRTTLRLLLQLVGLPLCFIGLCTFGCHANMFPQARQDFIALWISRLQRRINPQRTGLALMLRFHDPQAGWVPIDSRRKANHRSRFSVGEAGAKGLRFPSIRLRLLRWWTVKLSLLAPNLVL
jgi:hypothetical protein